MRCRPSNLAPEVGSFRFCWAPTSLFPAEVLRQEHLILGVAVSSVLAPSSKCKVTCPPYSGCIELKALARRCQNIRRTLDHAISRNLAASMVHGKRRSQQRFACLQRSGADAASYRLSVNRMLTERGTADTEHLEETIAAATTRSISDQRVCHVAMPLTHAWLVAMIDREQACAFGPDDTLDRICSAAQDHALALYGLQKKHWARTARQRRWHLMPVVIGAEGQRNA